MNAIQFTVSKSTPDENEVGAQEQSIPEQNDAECLSCSA